LETVEEVIVGLASGTSPVTRAADNRDTTGGPETVTFDKGAEFVTVTAYVRVKVAFDMGEVNIREEATTEPDPVALAEWLG
jgi:hypothetical protein